MSFANKCVIIRYINNKSDKRVHLVPTILQTAVHESDVRNYITDPQFRKYSSVWKQTCPSPKQVQSQSSDSSIRTRCKNYRVFKSRKARCHSTNYVSSDGNYVHQNEGVSQQGGKNLWNHNFFTYKFMNLIDPIPFNIHFQIRQYQFQHYKMRDSSRAGWILMQLEADNYLFGGRY